MFIFMSSFKKKLDIDPLFLLQYGNLTVILDRCSNISWIMLPCVLVHACRR